MSTLQKEEEGSGNSLESCLKADEKGFIHPFGDSKIRHKATSQAVTTASVFEETLLRLTVELEGLSGIPGCEETIIQHTLMEIEDHVHYVSKQLESMKRNEATQAAEKVKQLLGLLERSLETWRKQYSHSKLITVCILFLLSTDTHLLGRKMHIDSHRPL